MYFRYLEMRTVSCEDNDKPYCKQIGEGECLNDLPTRRKCLWKCAKCQCKDTDESCNESTPFKCEQIETHAILCPATCGLCGQGTEIYDILKRYVQLHKFVE